ncbi:MAG: prolyl aminopeptidase [Maricaulis sp.]|nr:prolyl aminopeptidase [Maricaulis sp.]
MTLFLPIEPYATGRLKVSGRHEIYYERSGKPGGIPALMLHGGPGSGCTPTHRRLFDPDVFDTLLIVQRGAGRSTPLAGLAHSTAQDLVADIEALRTELGIDRFVVFGPSWGSTLALLYAETHPESVRGVVVEGIFTGTPRELDWWLSPHGVARLFPDVREDLLAHVPERLHDAPAPELMAWFMEAMQAEWAAGAPVLDRLADASASLDDLRHSALYRWTEYEERLSYLEKSAEEARLSMAERGRGYVATHSLIEAHYFTNDCFLKPDQIIRDAGQLSRVPLHIIQSRYDMVCPAGTALRLADACPHARLTIIPVNGHAMTDSMRPVVIDAISSMATH